MIQTRDHKALRLSTPICIDIIQKALRSEFNPKFLKSGLILLGKLAQYLSTQHVDLFIDLVFQSLSKTLIQQNYGDYCECINMLFSYSSSCNGLVQTVIPSGNDVNTVISENSENSLPNQINYPLQAMEILLQDHSTILECLESSPLANSFIIPTLNMFIKNEKWENEIFQLLVDRFGQDSRDPFFLVTGMVLLAQTLSKHRKNADLVELIREPLFSTAQKWPLSWNSTLAQCPDPQVVEFLSQSFESYKADLTYDPEHEFVSSLELCWRLNQYLSVLAFDPENIQLKNSLSALYHSANISKQKSFPTEKKLAKWSFSLIQSILHYIHQHCQVDTESDSLYNQIALFCLNQSSSVANSGFIKSYNKAFIQLYSKQPIFSSETQCPRWIQTLFASGVHRPNFTESDHLIPLLSAYLTLRVNYFAPSGSNEATLMMNGKPRGIAASASTSVSLPLSQKPPKFVTLSCSSYYDSPKLRPSNCTWFLNLFQSKFKAPVFDFKNRVVALPSFSLISLLIKHISSLLKDFKPKSWSFVTMSHFLRSQKKSKSFKHIVRNESEDLLSLVETIFYLFRVEMIQYLSMQSVVDSTNQPSPIHCNLLDQMKSNIQLFFGSLCTVINNHWKWDSKKSFWIPALLISLSCTYDFLDHSLNAKTAKNLDSFWPFEKDLTIESIVVGCCLGQQYFPPPLGWSSSLNDSRFKMYIIDTISKNILSKPSATRDLIVYCSANSKIGPKVTLALAENSFKDLHSQLETLYQQTNSNHISLKSLGKSCFQNTLPPSIDSLIKSLSGFDICPQIALGQLECIFHIYPIPQTIDITKIAPLVLDFEKSHSSLTFLIQKLLQKESIENLGKYLPNTIDESIFDYFSTNAESNIQLFLGIIFTQPRLGRFVLDVFCSQVGDTKTFDVFWVFYCLLYVTLWKVDSTNEDDEEDEDEDDDEQQPLDEDDLPQKQIDIVSIQNAYLKSQFTPTIILEAIKRTKTDRQWNVLVQLLIWKCPPSIEIIKSLLQNSKDIFKRKLPVGITILQLLSNIWRKLSKAGGFGPWYSKKKSTAPQLKKYLDPLIDAVVIEEYQSAVFGCISSFVDWVVSFQNVSKVSLMKSFFSLIEKCFNTLSQIGPNSIQSFYNLVAQVIPPILENDAFPLEPILGRFLSTTKKPKDILAAFTLADQRTTAGIVIAMTFCDQLHWKLTPELLQLLAPKNQLRAFRFLVHYLLHLENDSTKTNNSSSSNTQSTKFNTCRIPKPSQEMLIRAQKIDPLIKSSYQAAIVLVFKLMTSVFSSSIFHSQVFANPNFDNTITGLFRDMLSSISTNIFQKNSQHNHHEIPQLYLDAFFQLDSIASTKNFIALYPLASNSNPVVQNMMLLLLEKRLKNAPNDHEIVGLYLTQLLKPFTSSLQSLLKSNTKKKANSIQFQIKTCSIFFKAFSRLLGSPYKKKSRKRMRSGELVELSVASTNAVDASSDSPNHFGFHQASLKYLNSLLPSEWYEKPFFKKVDPVDQSTRKKWLLYISPAVSVFVNYFLSDNQWNQHLYSDLCGALVTIVVNYSTISLSILQKCVKGCLGLILQSKKSPICISACLELITSFAVYLSHFLSPFILDIFSACLDPATTNCAFQAVQACLCALMINVPSRILIPYLHSFCFKNLFGPLYELKRTKWLFQDTVGQSLGNAEAFHLRNSAHIFLTAIRFHIISIPSWYSIRPNIEKLIDCFIFGLCDRFFFPAVYAYLSPIGVKMPADWGIFHKPFKSINDIFIQEKTSGFVNNSVSSIAQYFEISQATTTHQKGEYVDLETLLIQTLATLVFRDTHSNTPFNIDLSGGKAFGNGQVSSSSSSSSASSSSKNLLEYIVHVAAYRLFQVPHRRLHQPFDHKMIKQSKFKADSLDAFTHPNAWPVSQVGAFLRLGGFFSFFSDHWKSAYKHYFLQISGLLWQNTDKQMAFWTTKSNSIEDPLTQSILRSLYICPKTRTIGKVKGKTQHTTIASIAQILLSDTLHGSYMMVEFFLSQFHRNTTTIEGIPVLPSTMIESILPILSNQLLIDTCYDKPIVQVDSNSTRIHSTPQGQSLLYQRRSHSLLKALTMLCDVMIDQSLWNDFSSEIIQAHHSSNPQVRLNLLKLIQMCFKHIGKDLLSIIDQFTPILAESVQDENNSIGQQSKMTIETIESCLTAGESFM